MLSFKSLNATSGSTIQNSARWRDVFEFSARNVGPNVYTCPNANAANSASNCPETVKFTCFPKNSLEKSTSPSSVNGGFLASKVETRNISPAPSASEPVMIGVCK